MSAPLKLAGFATLLVLIFGVAVAAGDVIGPDRDASVIPEGGMGEHGAANPIRGLSIAEGGLALELQQTSPELVFTITEDGEPVREFELEHERRMHVIVVRRDGTGFQHVHPEDQHEQRGEPGELQRRTHAGTAS